MGDIKRLIYHSNFRIYTYIINIFTDNTQDEPVLLAVVHRLYHLAYHLVRISCISSSVSAENSGVMHRIYNIGAGQFATVAATNVNSKVIGFTRKAFSAAYSAEFILHLLWG